jgi:hypothetical protein
VVENPPIELQERRCPVCDVVLEIAWGRVQRKFYWYHPQNMKVTEQCKMRGRSRRWEDRCEALSATDIWMPEETIITPNDDKKTSDQDSQA